MPQLRNKKTSQLIMAFVITNILIGLPLILLIPTAQAAPFNPGGGPIQNPLQVDSVETLIIHIIDWLLGGTALLALLALVWGGGGIITAFGDETKLKGAKATIMGAIIGLIVVIGSYAILTAVTSLLNVK